MEPGNGQTPTTLWAPDTVIADTYRIPVAHHAPAGTYTLEIGMYGLVDIARLPVSNGDGNPLGDFILLETIEVK